MAIHQRTTEIKSMAIRHGFDSVGVSQATELTEEAKRLESWLHQGRQGSMHYMENHFDLRIDPRKLVEGAQSVISLMVNYFPEKPIHKAGVKVARYAYGKDYHKVIRKKLKALVQEMRSTYGDFNARVFVDSGPVMEREWAKRSGLGWIGKNTLLLSKGKGSYFFLAEIICDLALTPDGPVKNYCGNCTKCIDACPTQAIVAPYEVDASKCISYLTIERKESIDAAYRQQLDGWIFGCDICQEVCPINARSKPHQEEAFQAKSVIQQGKIEEWEEITREIFDEIFHDSPLKRRGYDKIKENLSYWKSNSSDNPSR